MRTAIRHRAHNVWRTLNPPRRRGTGWIEFGVLVTLSVTWIFLGSRVFPPPDYTNEPLNSLWFLAPYIAFVPWTIWYRNRHREEPAPQWQPDPRPLRPGMIYPQDWSDAWVQRHRQRWRLPGYRIICCTALVGALAIVAVGIYVAQPIILVIGLLVVAGLGRDWWLYS